MEELKIYTKEFFSNEVEKKVSSIKAPYMDVILELTKELNIEVETVPKLLTKDIIKKLEKESIEKRLLINNDENGLKEI